MQSRIFAAGIVFLFACFSPRSASSLCVDYTIGPRWITTVGGGLTYARFDVRDGLVMDVGYDRSKFQDAVVEIWDASDVTNPIRIYQEFPPVYEFIDCAVVGPGRYAYVHKNVTNVLELVGGSGGIEVDSDRIDAHEGYVFGVAEGALRVFDVSDEDAIVEIGAMFTLGGAPSEIAFHGDHAYFAQGSSIVIADISNPSSPTLAGTVVTPSQVKGLSISEGFLVVGAGDLRIYDLQVPTVPLLLSTFTDPAGEIGEVTAQGTLVVARGGPTIISIADPVHPQVMGYSGLDLGYVELCGDHLFGLGAAGITVADMTAPFGGADYEVVASVSRVEDSALLPDHLLLADGDDHRLRVLALDGFEEVGSVHVSEVRVDEVVASGDVAVVRDTDGVFWTIDLTDPTSPQVAGSISDRYYMDIVANGTLFYALTTNSIRIYDLADPALPVLRGMVTLPLFTSRYIDYDNGLCGVVGTDGYLFVDVSEPDNPAVLGGDPYSSVRTGVCMAGNFAYLSAGVVLQTLDISDPSLPVEVDVDRGPLSAGRTVRHDKYLYDRTSGGVIVFDVANPADPVYLGCAFAGVAGRGSTEVFDDQLVICGRDSQRLLPIHCTPAGAPEPAFVPPIRITAAPNPLQEHTVIRWQRALPAGTRISILDVAGRRIRSWDLEASDAAGQRIDWNGKDGGGRRVPAGTYYLRLAVPGMVIGQPLVVVR